MNSPTKEEIKKAFEIFCKEDPDEMDSNEVAEIFYHAYLEAVEALRHARAQLEHSTVLIITENGKGVPDYIDAILEKAPEVKKECTVL